jgi:putative DNA primase/helicase
MPQEDNPRESAEGSESHPEEPLQNIAYGELSLEEDLRRVELMRAAQRYADRGWRVHPLCWVEEGTEGCGYSPHNIHGPCHSPGKRAILDDWPHRATNIPAEAVKWWRTPSGSVLDNSECYPFASIGVVLGEGSGIFALDVDPRNGGDVKLELLQRQHGELPHTRVQKTGGDGEHWIFQWPGFRVYNIHPWDENKQSAGLDIKGDGGYIVMPPSISHKGWYEITDMMDQVEPAHAPEWILKPLRREHEEQTGTQLSTPEPIPNQVISAYVTAAMNAERDALARTPEGGRNDQLNTSAFSLGTLGAHGLINEEEAKALLREAALAGGMSTGEFAGTFRSGWNSGKAHPRDLSSVGSISHAKWPRLPRTEFDLGERLVIYYGDYLRWVDDWQTWLSYSGGIWRRRTRDEAERYAQQMIKMLPITEGMQYDETVDPVTGESPRAVFMEWAAKQKVQTKKTSIWKIARDVAAMKVEPDQFDTHPELLNAANGIIDLRTGRLGPHDPELLLTMRTTVSYDPKAECPRWMEFLEQVQPIEEMRAYLQLIVGYSITGSTGAQVMFLHHGTGANGKSVFHEVIGFILGGYKQTVPIESLVDSSMDRIPNDVARMVGRRYMTSAESKAGKFLDEPKIKLLTGGDTVSARFMRGEFFEFKPQGKIHLITNHLPRMSDDSATWRRIHLITWPVSIPEAERKDTLADDLYREEGPGILRWMVEGAVQWMASRSVDAPPVALAAKEDFKHSEDDDAQWIEEQCEIDWGNELLTNTSETRVLFAHNKDWRTENGCATRSKRTFISSMKKRGFIIRTLEDGRVGFPQLSVRQRFV